MKKITKKQSLTEIFFDYTKNINDSKLFAGLVILVLNISSKFVSVPLSKTMESYVKHSFSRHILVFAMAWMGTRDIFIALIITILFFVLMEFFLNEQSSWCVLPEGFTSYHVGLLEINSKMTSEEIETMTKLLEKAQKLKKELE
jgi:hypothetical protein